MIIIIIIISPVEIEIKEDHKRNILTDEETENSVYCEYSKEEEVD